LCLALLVAVVLAPAYQAHIQTTVSLYKHVVFGSWFGAIAGGYALSKARVVNAAKGWRVGVAAAILTALVGFDQASGWYGYWPNSRPLIAALEAHLPVSQPILMQGGDQMVANYYLLHRSGGHAPPLVWSSYLYSPTAISIMIEDHAVSIVETDTGTGIPPSNIQESVAGTPHGLQRAGYRRVAHIPWRDPDGAVGWFSIWQLVRKS